MMRFGNIFEREGSRGHGCDGDGTEITGGGEGSRGHGMRTVSGVTIAVIICSLLSGIAAIGIILNFEAVTARIAVFVVRLLSSAFPVLLVVIAILYLAARLRWRWHRDYRRW